MRRSIAAALLFAALAAPVSARGVTIDTATGTVAVPANPETVAVFDIAALDTLHALGVEVAGIPSPVFLDSLADMAEQATRVGTLFEPDFEALAVMQPDLIIAGGRSSTQVKALSRIAPTIDMTIEGDDLLAQARARIAAYGAVFGVPEKASTLTAALDSKLEDTARAVEGRGDALILLTNGGKISAYGANGRFGWLHRALDLPEAVEGLGAENHGQSVSFEFVAEADPDWLLIIDRGAAIGAEGEAAATTLDNPLIARTKAAQNGRIVYLDAAPLYIAAGGANALQHTLDEIKAAFAGGDS